jgi:hypothetical protein
MRASIAVVPRDAICGTYAQDQSLAYQRFQDPVYGRQRECRHRFMQPGVKRISRRVFGCLGKRLKNRHPLCRNPDTTVPALRKEIATHVPILSPAITRLHFVRIISHMQIITI